MGSRVYLRSLDENDATSDYASWMNDPEVNRFLVTKSATRQSLSEYILKKNLQADALFLGIFLGEEDRHIGTIKLEPIDEAAHEATIAIMVGDKKSWGQGLGGEAMKILIDYACKALQITRISLVVFGSNVIAINAYVKLGFKETNRKTQAVHSGDEVFDQVTMVLDLGINS